MSKDDVALKLIPCTSNGKNHASVQALFFLVIFFVYPHMHFGAYPYIPQLLYFRKGTFSLYFGLHSHLKFDFDLSPFVSSHMAEFVNSSNLWLSLFSCSPLRDNPFEEHKGPSSAFEVVSMHAQCSHKHVEDLPGLIRCEIVMQNNEVCFWCGVRWQISMWICWKCYRST